MLRIGLVGAKDSIELIYEVGSEYSEQALFMCYPYTHKEDTVSLVEMYDGEMDVILFSGRVPFNISKSHAKTQKPCVYVPHNGSCIYRTLWDIRDAGLKLENVSFDTILEKEIREIYKELRLDDSNICVFEFDGDVDYEQLALYHIEKSEDNPNHVAVTCLYKTYEILKSHGINVFRVNLTKALIRQVIENAIYEGNSTILKANQIAVVLLDIDNFKKHIQSYNSEYDVQKLKLKFNEMLIDYAKCIEGSVFTFGSDEFLLFTTGGAMEGELHEKERIDFLSRVQRELGLLVSMGIGYGKTAYEAENHARIGVHHAKKYGGDCVFVVDRFKTVIGPLARNEMLTFSYRSDDEEMIKIANETGLTIKNILKLASMLKKHGNEITSKELAFYLNVTERSARRILSTLLEKGYCSVSGEENATNKGRPRNVYHVQLK